MSEAANIVARLDVGEAIPLPLYQAMCEAIALVHRIDEIKDIRDKAMAMRLYAIQRDARELASQVSEIRIRAELRLGELIRDLEKAQGARTELPNTADMKLKTDAIKSAGITPMTAHRLERLTGGDDPEARQAAKKAAENVFQLARTEGKPVTRARVQQAVDAEVAKIRPAAPVTKLAVKTRKEREVESGDAALFGHAVSTIAERVALTGSQIARLHSGEQIDWRLDHGRRALARLQDYVAALEGRTGRAG